MRSLFAVVVLAAGLVGCAGEPVSPKKHNLEAEQEALNRARQVWRDANLRNYSFDFHVNCFCLPIGNIRVRVVDGAFSTMVWADSGTAVNADNYPGFLTMDSVFSTVQRWLNQAPDTMVMRFDSIWGYPKGIAADWYDVTDGGIGLSVLLVEPTSR